MLEIGLVLVLIAGLTADSDSLLVPAVAVIVGLVLILVSNILSDTKEGENELQ